MSDNNKPWYFADKVRTINSKSQKHLNGELQKINKQNKKLSLKILSTSPVAITVPRCVKKVYLRECNTTSLRFAKDNVLSLVELPLTTDDIDFTNGKRIKTIIADDSKVTRLPTLDALEHVDINHSSLNEIAFQPKIVTLNCDYTPLKMLPVSMTLKNLSIVDCDIKELPSYTSLELLCCLSTSVTIIPATVSKTLKIYIGDEAPLFTAPPRRIEEVFIRNGDVHYAGDKKIVDSDVEVVPINIFNEVYAALMGY